MVRLLFEHASQENGNSFGIAQDHDLAANEEPKVTRSAKRANIPDERTQKGNLISIMNLFSSTSTGSNDSRFCIITLLKNILDQSK